MCADENKKSIDLGGEWASVLRGLTWCTRAVAFNVVLAFVAVAVWPIFKMAGALEVFLVGLSWVGLAGSAMALVGVFLLTGAPRESQIGTVSWLTFGAFAIAVGAGLSVQFTGRSAVTDALMFVNLGGACLGFLFFLATTSALARHFERPALVKRSRVVGGLMVGTGLSVALMGWQSGSESSGVAILATMITLLLGMCLVVLVPVLVFFFAKLIRQTREMVARETGPTSGSASG